MEEPVTIVDRDILKALAVETRMDILKELSQGGRTPSDLSKKLDKSNATIVEHLNSLVKVGLIKRVEQPGKKWVFYTLTERGYGIVSSKSRRLIIILATSLLALGASITSFAYHQTRFVFYAKEALPAEGKVVSQPIVAQPFFYLSIILFVIALGGIGFYIYKKIKCD